MRDLRPYFPHARVLREGGGDTMLCDPDFDAGCGYASFNEVGILSAIAAEFRGQWCEIGSHTGWTAAHIAAAGNDVTAVDIGFMRDAMRDRAQENWHRAYDAGEFDFFPFVVGTTSEEFFLNSVRPKQFDGFFIDGNHTAPEPLNDSKNALARLAPRGVIVLHDARGQPIKDAIEWLRGQGLQVKTWETMNGMAAAWRGAAVMP